MKPPNFLNDDYTEAQQHFWDIFHWEFLRRSKEYNDDYNKCTELIGNSFSESAKSIGHTGKKKTTVPFDDQPTKSDKQLKIISNKYGFTLNPRSFPPPPPEFTVLDKEYNYNPACRIPEFGVGLEGVSYLSPKGLHNYSKKEQAIDPIEYLESSWPSESRNNRYILVLEIDLRRPQKELNKAIEETITDFKHSYKLYSNTSGSNPRWEEFRKYLRIYDLKSSVPRLANYKIGCIVFPEGEISEDEIEKNLRGEGNESKRPLVQKVDKYYRRAQQLIKNAVFNDFPGQAP